MGEGNKQGRPPFVPSDDQRATVRRMAGAKHRTIADCLGISVPTLRKAFREELRARDPADLFDAPPATRRTGHNGGRHAKTFTLAQRAEVETLAAMGMSLAAIARAQGLSEPTLKRAFAAELETGEARVEARLLANLRRAADKGSVAANRELLDRIERARLARLEAALGSQPDAAKPDAPGKKLAAQHDAQRVLDDTELGALLRH